MLIYPQQPMDFWHTPDTLCPPPPPIIVSLDGIPAHFMYRPYDLMATDRFEPLDVSGVKADCDSDPFLAPYTPRNYQDVVIFPFFEPFVIEGPKKLTELGRWKPGAP
jgi:hypothetical protein